jgi:hypothetical protein
MTCNLLASTTPAHSFIIEHKFNNKRVPAMLEASGNPTAVHRRYYDMISLSLKRCSACGKWKSRSEFYKNKGTKDGLANQCKECRRSYLLKPDVQERDRRYKREWARTNYNPQAGRNKNLQNNYGISIAEFNQLFESQGGKCAVCENTLEVKGKGAFTAHVDHDHKTGKVRGLLCQSCNFVLGHGRDDVNILVKAINYLLKNE